MFRAVLIGVYLTGGSDARPSTFSSSENPDREPISEEIENKNSIAIREFFSEKI